MTRSRADAVETLNTWWAAYTVAIRPTGGTPPPSFVPADHDPMRE